jgi:hypothetical protein
MPIDTKQMDSGVAVVTVTGRLVLGKDVDIGTLVACLTQIKKAKGDLRMAGAKARMLRLFKNDRSG